VFRDHARPTDARRLDRGARRQEARSGSI
jgi:hypothetical protein